MSLNPYIVNNLWAPSIRAFYREQFHEMILMDKAHGLMLVKQKLLNPGDYHVIDKGLNQVEASLKESDLDGELGDLYYNITQRLYDIVGEEAGCLIHVGRSRNDMCCACNRMQVRRGIWSMAEHMNEVMELLINLAWDNLDTVITFYTFGQPAQPGTLAHYLVMVFDLMARDYKRFQAAYQNTNRSPMGAAAGIGTGFPLDREYVCDLLGFDSVLEHTLDAISSPDYLLETEAAAAIMMSGLSKLAQDLFFWASYEYQLLDCNFSIATSSSIMPQKKNPTCFEHMRAQTGRAAGMLSEALAMTRNTSLFPNIESTVDVFGSFAASMAEVEKALGLLKVGLENSTIQKSASYEYTRNNFTGAASMAEHLARKYELPFTKTHHIVNGIIRRLMEQGSMKANCFTGELMKEISKQVLGEPLLMTDKEVQQMMDPLFCLNSVVTGGTPKPKDTEKMLVKARETLRQQKQWLDESRNKVLTAYERIQSGTDSCGTKHPKDLY